MKEVEENYHYTIWAICNECVNKYGGYNGHILQHDRLEQLQMKFRMTPYSRRFSEFRFECRICGKMLIAMVKELEEKWEVSRDVCDFDPTLKLCCYECGSSLYIKCAEKKDEVIITCNECKDEWKLKGRIENNE